MTKDIIPIDAIARRITVVRGQRVIVDSDLADLYGVSTGAFNQAIKRNKERFPEDFGFQLTQEEYDFLRSQTVILKTGRGQHRKYLPYAFTEAGALQAASLLNSPRAIQAGIFVHRAFVQLRDLLATHKNIAKQLTELEKRVSGHDKDLVAIVDALRQLLNPAEPKPKRRPIGFHPPGEDEE